jgi:hypothetical protein
MSQNRRTCPDFRIVDNWASELKLSEQEEKYLIRLDDIDHYYEGLAHSYNE